MIEVWIFARKNCINYCILEGCACAASVNACIRTKEMELR